MPYHRGKQRSALINDWESIVANWKEPNQSETLADKCNLFHTLSGSGDGQRSPENSEIYTFI